MRPFHVVLVALAALVLSEGSSCPPVPARRQTPTPSVSGTIVIPQPSMQPSVRALACLASTVLRSFPFL